MKYFRLSLILFVFILFFANCSKSPEQKIEEIQKPLQTISEAPNPNGQLIVWSEALNVGVAVINTQHKNIVSLVNQLNNLVKENKSADAKENMLDKIIADVPEHFATEEKLMKQTSYSKLLDNQQLHSDFTQKCVELQLKVKAGKTEINTEVITFLKDWLTNHVSGPDKEMGTYLVSKGIK